MTNRLVDIAVERSDTRPDLFMLSIADVDKEDRLDEAGVFLLTEADLALLLKRVVAAMKSTAGAS